ncbi:zinc finger MIZ domain-containing protein 1-like isoform X2 [Paramacrobiotus metropolitanus]|uniref:zinc finger MIZ domain-containing protein 1-like isoform X2 n=1 Tax=Paramacrobiotus metropolitanus TaxID=2943436 RepID=UPI00244570C8|nr:zinc finger MIZ domain-containing protein 1-like isoform X2 [Paramacrobiotus metropolitanus]
MLRGISLHFDMEPSAYSMQPNSNAAWNPTPTGPAYPAPPYPNGAVYANQNANPNMNVNLNQYPAYPPPGGGGGPAPPPMYSSAVKKEAGMYGDMDIRSVDKFGNQQVFPEQTIPAMNHAPGGPLSHPNAMGVPRQPVYAQYPGTANGVPTQYYDTMPNVPNGVPKYLDQHGMPMEQRTAAPGSMRGMPGANGPMGSNRARPYHTPNGKANGMVNMGPKRLMMAQQQSQPMANFQTVVTNQQMLPNPYGHESISPAPFAQQMPPYNPQQKAQTLPPSYQRRPDPGAASYPPTSLSMQQSLPMDNRNYPQYMNAPPGAPGGVMMRGGPQPANPMFAGGATANGGPMMEGPYNVGGQAVMAQSFNGNGMGPLEIKQFANPMVGAPDPQQMMMVSNEPPFVAKPDLEPTMTIIQHYDPIIPPFRLEHDRPNSQKTFELRPEVYNGLTQNPQLQVELKCYRPENTWFTNWPDAISVAVNGRPVAIQRGGPQQPHRPLHIKELLRPNKRNVISFHAQQCCCSHLFVLHVVHRPTIRSVINHVVKFRTVAIPQGIERLKSNFISGGRGFAANDELVLPLRCVLSRQRIVLPARSSLCQHAQCFDLESYLLHNSTSNIFMCPICKCSAPIDNLQVDEFMSSILKQCLSNPAFNQIDSVLVDVNGGWRPNVPLKLSPDEAPRYNPVSPSTTISSWEHSSPGSARCPSYPPERSVSVGRNTPKGPASVGHPLCNGDYGSPASMPATVPVSPTGKVFPGLSSCPQKSPTPSMTAADSRTPVPQVQSVHSNGSNGSLPSTPRTPGSHPPSNNPTDFLDINFEAEGDTDNDALQLISNMTETDLFMFFENPTTDPLGTSSTSLGSSFPNSAGAGSDSGISVASTNPANSSAEDLLSLSLFDSYDAQPTVKSES